MKKRRNHDASLDLQCPIAFERNYWEVSQNAFHKRRARPRCGNEYMMEGIEGATGLA